MRRTRLSTEPIVETGGVDRLGPEDGSCGLLEAPSSQRLDASEGPIKVRILIINPRSLTLTIHSTIDTDSGTVPN